MLCENQKLLSGYRHGRAPLQLLHLSEAIKSCNFFQK
ncbi:hypothetical protein T4A_1396 [Trichinella pseudospiralis]|uniref:Uncharacterized protein n=1 Tax=Trichinella pseudospiralis TaxID=6337 RepID=A0A0V1DJ57_TRIPS|nr:hypothetical protein T4A_1396 [Trichinella pseudospiralis]